MRACMHVRLCVRWRVCVGMCSCSCVCVRVFVCVCACLFVCVCVGVCVCVCLGSSSTGGGSGSGGGRGEWHALCGHGRVGLGVGGRLGMAWVWEGRLGMPCVGMGVSIG